MALIIPRFTLFDLSRSERKMPLYPCARDNFYACQDADVSRAIELTSFWL